MYYIKNRLLIFNYKIAILECEIMNLWKRVNRFSLVIIVLISLMSFTQENISVFAYPYSTCSSSAREIYGLTEKCQDGTILHAWNWYFIDVTKNMKDIAEAGYTSIQVSPVQGEKKEQGLPKSTKWWALYQPVNFKIGNILGTRNEFIEMCETAHEYGVKIIVDVVTNHLANKADNDIYTISPQIDKELRENSNFWHNIDEVADNSCRFNMTQKSIGMPDLNTGNKQLQKIILDFLNDCQECGADGFRFDAAKHIELPDDPPECSSDYWPTIISGIKNKDKDSYIYGELLGPLATREESYTKFMSITADVYGSCVRKAINERNAGWAWSYQTNINAKQLVTWVESHDTYACNGEQEISASLTDQEIKLGWCLIAGRADSAPLYFVRPKDGLRGEIGGPGDGVWKDALVVEANKFHNEMAGKSEYIRIPDFTVFMVERGNNAAILTNVGYGEKAILTETGLEDGEYWDVNHEGSKFIVEEGHLKGTIGSETSAILRRC